MSTPNGSGLSSVVVDVSAAGDNIIIPASSGFFIRRLLIAAASQTTVQFKAGARVLSGPLPITVVGLGFSDQAYYACEPGEAFVITLGSAVSVGGTIWFQRGPL